MQSKSIALYLAAASSVSATSSSNDFNHSNRTFSTAVADASQMVGVGVFGVAVVAGVAMLL
ncbi:hypothetical protein METBIDRAFT_30640 [Metschnikowia bicuspidata var. bicuspidata NRRL YB-4993]|uniref:Uncharacterized protein n=1 Tax=Metschnikowia bicuspidata var. bicuspidata NRRL YB-4993 TaxID=869754 RepID=A0A1A0HJZ7_9ASCO|nr:hypothetical protein METBIDRAFT_30640 [Metschnikowia bicuspidata var. bicuspidata NRRL YB-4993]OBA24345.1 hypothetical protein METBIDRAFT_30640 [Metschnikowia bicuspidata var. bicuspidata NRRL YB-4993]